MTGFDIVPAIPVAYGRVIGPASRSIPAGHNPLAVAWHWMTQGARCIHVEDMGLGRTGFLQTAPALLLACQPGPARILVGGGIRDAKSASLLTSHGADTLVVGHAWRDPLQFLQLTQTVPAHQLMIALGAASAEDEGTADDVARATAAGVRQILLTGPWNAPILFPFQQDMIRRYQAAGLNVWVAGGIRHLKTIRLLKDLGVAGVMIGESLYRGRLSFAELQSLAEPAVGPH